MAKKAKTTSRKTTAPAAPPVGPRGGTTTTTAAGKRRAEIYFAPEVWQAVRAAAFEGETSHSAVVEACCRAALKLGAEQR